MKYTKLSDNELVEEIKRVNEVIRNAHDPFTYKQNKKYLEKLERERKRRR